MPLIVEDIIKEGLTLAKGVSPFYIEVESKYLSRPYQLSITDRYWAKGIVLDVSKTTGPLPREEEEVIRKHVLGKNIRLFILPALLTAYDRLYFDEESWSILRDAGYQ